MLLPTPRYLPNPEMETVSLALTSPALTGRFFTTRATWEARVCVCTHALYIGPLAALSKW